MLLDPWENRKGGAEGLRKFPGMGASADLTAGVSRSGRGRAGGFSRAVSKGLCVNTPCKVQQHLVTGSPIQAPALFWDLLMGRKAEQGVRAVPGAGEFELTDNLSLALESLAFAV